MMSAGRTMGLGMTLGLTPGGIALPPFYGIAFDGGDIITVPNFDPTGNSGENLSVFCWVKDDGSAVAFESPIGQFDTGANQRSWGISRDNVTTSMRVIVAEDGAGVAIKNYSSSVAVFDGSWHHVGFTWGGGTLTLYIDGVADSSVTKTTDDAMTALHASTAAITLGAWLNSGAILLPFGGSLTQCYISPTTLSAAAVAVLRLDTKPTGAIASWAMLPIAGQSVPTATSVRDESGNGHTGTFGGGANAPTWTSAFRRLTSGGPS